MRLREVKYLTQGHSYSVADKIQIQLQIPIGNDKLIFKDKQMCLKGGHIYMQKMFDFILLLSLAPFEEVPVLWVTARVRRVNHSITQP